MNKNEARTPSPGWIPDTSTFGARLALIRWRMDWNIAEAERECGITQNNWSNWEAGAMPRNYIEAVGKIAWRTQVDRIWLMDGSGSPVPTANPRTLDYSVGESDLEGDEHVAPLIDIWTRMELAPTA